MVSLEYMVTNWMPSLRPRAWAVSHILRVDIGAGHRLFAEDILARFEGRHGGGHVVVVVQAHVYGLDVVARQQLVQVRVASVDAIHACHALGFGLVDVGDGDDLDVGHLGVCFDVAFADLADADHPDAYFFHGGHGQSSRIRFKSANVLRAAVISSPSYGVLSMPQQPS